MSNPSDVVGAGTEIAEEPSLQDGVELVVKAKLNDFLKESGFYDMIASQAEKDPDAFKSALVSMGKAEIVQYVIVDNKIKVEELEKRLTITEAISLLANQVFAKHFAEILFTKKRDYKTTTYDEACAIYEKNGGRKLGGHMIWDGEALSPLGEIYMVLSTLKLKNEKREAFPLPVGTRLIMPAGEVEEDSSIKLPKFEMTKAYVESFGIRFTMLVPGETIIDPDPKGIQYIAVPDGLPLNSAKNGIDMDKLKWYAELWKKEDVHCQWCSVSTLVAAIQYYLADGAKDAEQVLTETLGSGAFTKQQIDLLNTIKLPSQVEQAPAATAPVAPAVASATPEGSVAPTATPAPEITPPNQ